MGEDRRYDARSDHEVCIADDGSESGYDAGFHRAKPWRAVAGQRSGIDTIRLGPSAIQFPVRGRTRGNKARIGDGLSHQPVGAEVLQLAAVLGFVSKSIGSLITASNLTAENAEIAEGNARNKAPK